MEDSGERDAPLKGVSIVDGKEINGSVTSFVDDVAKKSIAKRHAKGGSGGSKLGCPQQTQREVQGKGGYSQCGKEGNTAMG